jgi:signal transduction histidine kinase/anti-sigma regulatory factor (Ser/Thr protein kinase)
MSISTTPKKVAFRPQSRLISLLGEQLISDQAVGLIELVKNAYDADATCVDIQLLSLTNPTTTSIIIRDNGTGMTRDDIEQKWLSPAVSHKEKQKKNRQRTPLGRLPIGEKGVGRFATHQLGRQFQLVSRSGLEPEVVVQINWDDFDRGDTFLDDIPVMLYEREPLLFTDSTTGTYLNMLQARNPWNEPLVAKVQSTLRRLQSPHKDEHTADFQITFRCPDFPAYEDLGNSDILDHAHYVFRGLVTDDGRLDYEYVCHHPDLPERESRDDDYDLLPAAVGEMDKSTEKYPPFYINLYVWDRTPEYLNRSGVSRTDLDAMAGVSIFRDRLRVLPYGEAGNDWLDLDKERINNMSGRIGNQQVVGFIEVSQEETSGLRDKTNREGLIDTADFRNLRALVRAAINVFTTMWLQDRPDGRKRSKPRLPDISVNSLGTARTIAEKVSTTASDDIVVPIEAPPHIPSTINNNDVPPPVQISTLSTTTSMQAQIEQPQVSTPARPIPAVPVAMPEANPTTLLTQRQAMNQLLTHLQDAAVYQQTHETDAARKEHNLMHLAATGMAAERVTHEFGRQVGAALRALQVLRGHMSADGEAMQAIYTLEACLGTLRNEFRVLAPYEAGWRTQRTATVSVGEAARLAFMLNQELIDTTGIITNIQGNDFEIVARSASLVQILDNLVHNACIWLEGWKGTRCITILLNSDEHDVTIADTGPGIPLYMYEDIFQPFVTLRNGGRGLGLYITQELLRSMHGSIALKQPSEESQGAQFVLQFPTSDMI